MIHDERRANVPDGHLVVEFARSDDSGRELADALRHGAGHGVELDHRFVRRLSYGQRT